MKALPRGLPDYTRKIIVEYTGTGYETAGIYLVRDVSQRSTNVSITDYLKGACILPNYAVVADPTGMMVSYEGGYAARALIKKAGVGEVALAKNVLDEYVAVQRSDGSWCQQFRPERNTAGAHTEYEDLQVDAGAALLAHAMADYDASIGIGSIIYKTQVQLAFNFLRAAQLAHYNAHGTGLLANQRKIGVWNTGALAADCAEVLLAALAVLDQYGTDLTNQAGYSIKSFGNDLNYAIAQFLWKWNGENYYRTEYPTGTTVWGLPTVSQGISFTQALCAMAMYKWGISAHQESGDYSAQSEKALNWITALAQGKWGGFYYAPLATGMGNYYDEFPAYTALVIMAYDAVNATLYAAHKARAIRFLQLCTLPYGEVFNLVHINGRLDQADMGESGEGTMHFRALNTELALLAGA